MITIIITECIGISNKIYVEFQLILVFWVKKQSNILPVVAVQLALCQQFGVVPLSEHFIAAYGNRVREVQRPRLVYHRYTNTSVGILHKHVLGYSACLFAEDDIRSVWVAYIGVGLASFRGKEEVFTSLCLFKEIIDTVIVGDVDQIPVVESRSFKVAVGYLKAEGSYKVEPCSGSGAGARYVACVLGYLRLKKNDIERFFVIICQFI